MIKNFNNLPTIQLSYIPKFKLSERPKIRGSADLYQILMSNWNHHTIDFIEEFKVIFLNKSGVLLGILPIGSGGMNSVPVDIRLVLGPALKCGASGIVLAHNHPSGNLLPSNADRAITNQIVKGAVIFNIAVIDHVIVTSDGYFSFAENELIKTPA